jgi:O-antigen/teichoic acid export membrane protein
MPVCEQVSEIHPSPLEGGMSWRSNFAWMLSGNIVYAACQWGMVIALAKLGNSFMVGQFSLGLAITTPVLMFTNLQLRAVQATDAKRRHSFGEYLGLRVMTTLVALAVIAGIAGFGGYERETALVILAVALMKSVESLSDIFYGLFQLNDHLEQTGRSMMLRGFLSVIGLSAGLYLTKSLVWGIATLAGVWLAILIGFDARHGRRFAAAPTRGRTATLRNARWRKRNARWRKVWPTFRLDRQWKLARLTLPLGIVMTLVSLNLNMPRYFIHARFGEHQLGIFSAMAYTTVVVATFADALGHSTIPRMARLYANGNLDGFRSSLLQLVALGAGFALAGFIAVRFLGARLLTILFSAEYADHVEVFVWLIAAAGISCIAALLHYGITSAQCFRIQVPMFLLVVGSNALACAWLVPSIGLRGGAMAMVIASLVHLAATSGILVYLFSTHPKNEIQLAATEAYCDNWETGL